jgi:hypothetical protein
VSKLVFRNTSRYPDEEVRRLVDLALEGQVVEGVAVWVKDAVAGGGAFRGLARSSNKRGTFTNNVAVKHPCSVSIGAPTAYPVQTGVPRFSFRRQAHSTFEESATIKKVWDRSGRVQYMRIELGREGYGGYDSPIFRMESWDEALVAVTAHEFNHVLQFRAAAEAGRSWSPYPTMEAECEKFALARLEAYRAARAAGIAPAPVVAEAPHAGHTELIRHGSTSDKIRALAALGMSRSEIAKKLDIRYQVVRGCLEREKNK